MSSTRPSATQNSNRRPRRTVRTSALTIALAAAGVLGTAAPQTHAAPARARTAQAAHHNDPSTCRGEGVDPTARIRYRSDVVIKAPLSTVFALQTDVERWPAWQAPVLTMKRLDPGPLREGSRFRWT
ncbi:hypothetical protein JBE04_41960, partial [Streptomyces sp. PRKS01-29]|nr:hypothetical protein [Streptomyces sabulosicollis]